MKKATSTTLEGDTAGDAVRKILHGLLADLQSPLESTVKGQGPEPLHDLRVAARRARTAFSQLKRALPSDAVSHFLPELKWLGDLTGECRDLDVWIDDLEALRRSLPEGDSAPLSRIEGLVQGARDRAHNEVVGGLSSDRFRQLLIDWEIFLSENPLPLAAPPDAEAAVKDVADRRIRRAYQRVRTFGRDLGSDPDAAALHQLRIQAKKYRYLLEFFSSLCESEKIDSRIKELKALQNVLGELNDRDFQRTRITSFADALKADSDTGALAFMRRLKSDIERRQEELRGNVPDCLAAVISRRWDQTLSST